MITEAIQIAEQIIIPTIGIALYIAILFGILTLGYKILTNTARRIARR